MKQTRVKMKSIGFLYIAYGEKYRLEARRSAQSLLNHMPNSDITLITHCEFDAPEFSRVIVKPMQGSYMDKMKFMRESPYDRTLFIDTDTYICENLTQLFGLLDYYDIAMAVENGRPEWKNLPSGLTEMTEFNTGVILFRKCPSVKSLLELWGTVYQNRQNIDWHDQTSMAIALAQIPIQLTVLPREFNVRAIYPQVLYRKVSIVHARLRNVEKTIKRLNSWECSGNWLPAEQKCVSIRGSWLRRLISAIRRFLRPVAQKIRARWNLEGDLIMPSKGRFED